MASYDQGGGCPCGLQRECDCYHSLPQQEKDRRRVLELKVELKRLLEKRY